MDKLLICAVRAMKSLFIPDMITVLIKSVVITIASLFAFILFSSFFFIWLGHMLQGHMLANFLPWIGGIGSTLVAWMMFPGVMPLVVSFFDDTIARLIEEHDYPQTLQASRQDLWTEFWINLRFALLAIGLNLLVLPLYLMPGLNLVLFYWLNGYLLGREFFQMIARRHLSARDSSSMYHRHSITIVLVGMSLALLATIPLVNLFAPFWGIAVMVHLYHRLEPTLTVELVSTTGKKTPNTLFNDK